MSLPKARVGFTFTKILLPEKDHFASKLVKQFYCLFTSKKTTTLGQRIRIARRARSRNLGLTFLKIPVNIEVLFRAQQLAFGHVVMDTRRVRGLLAQARGKAAP